MFRFLSTDIPAPLRLRRWLIARRWCFFILLSLGVLAFLFWGISSHNLFLRISVWLVFAFWLVTLLQVVYCKFFPPVVTPLMIRRFFQNRGASDSVPLRDGYRFVPLESISPLLVSAVDCSENYKLFAYCRGFLFKGLCEAYLSNQHDGAKRGGSCISQQTAKNCFLPHSRTLLRKLIEAYYVVLIDLFWGKRHIMEVYLNIIEFGPGIYGCEAASQHYFHHSAASLSEHEAVLLAATLPWPLRANPDHHKPYFDSRVSHIYRYKQEYTPINWDASLADLDPQCIEEGNRGLLFFIKWLLLKKIKHLKQVLLHG